MYTNGGIIFLVPKEIIAFNDLRKREGELTVPNDCIANTLK